MNDVPVIVRVNPFQTQSILEGWNELVILNGNLERCHGRNARDNYSAVVLFAPYDADRDYSEEERVEHSVVVAGVEVAIRKKTGEGQLR
jgi:hypothetical protein